MTATTTMITEPTGWKPASAKGGTFHFGSWSPVSRAEATPMTSSRTEIAKSEPLSFGCCDLAWLLLATKQRQV
jgi:hypothetical protein